MSRSPLEVSGLQIMNFLTAKDDVQVTPSVVGVELNHPEEFDEDTNPISVSRLTMDPNAGFERHVHPHNHLLIILEGSGFLTYDRGDGEDTRLEFGQGSVFDVPGTREHAVSAGEEGITMLSIASPIMKLLDPERMVFVEEHHRWMVPAELDR